MHARNLQFCAFLLFGANNLQIRKKDYASRIAEILAPMTCRFAKNDYAGRLAEMEKTHSVGLVQNLLQASCDGVVHAYVDQKVT
jgi:hypothetical protein